MKHILTTAATLLLTGNLMAQTAATTAKPAYHLIKKTVVGGEGGWDYLLAEGGRLYLSHGNQVEVLDQKTYEKWTPSAPHWGCMVLPLCRVRG